MHAYIHAHSDTYRWIFSQVSTKTYAHTMIHLHIAAHFLRMLAQSTDTHTYIHAYKGRNHAYMHTHSHTRTNIDGQYPHGQVWKPRTWKARLPSHSRQIASVPPFLKDDLQSTYLIKNTDITYGNLESTYLNKNIDIKYGYLASTYHKLRTLVLNMVI
jgi:hypothetical protein